MKETTETVINQRAEFLGSLMKVDLPLMKNVLTALVKSSLIPLGVIAAASATDAAIQNKIFELEMTALIISNEVKEDIIKIVKSLEESVFLTNGFNETIQNESKKQKSRFLDMLSSILGASLLQSMIAGRVVIRPCEGTISAGQYC